MTTINTAREHYQSRLADLKAYFYAEPEWKLVDDGTLDTVLSCDPDGEIQFRLTIDDRADYTQDDGTLDLEAIARDYGLEDDAHEQLRERFYEYGLSFEWVEGIEDEPGFYCFLLSWGGPSEEIRFYVDGSQKLYKAQFVYRDWGTHAKVEPQRDWNDGGVQLFRDLFEHFAECEALEAARARAYV